MLPTSKHLKFPMGYSCITMVFQEVQSKLSKQNLYLIFIFEIWEGFFGFIVVKMV